MSMEPPARVLVVDDDPRIRAMLRRMLEAWGCSVSEAADGSQGFELAINTRPDLILLDVSMPVVDGLSCTRQLRDNPVTQLIPIVIVTGAAGLQERVDGLEAGADYYLLKPFQPVELRARVRSLLRLKRLHDSLESAENVIFSLVRAIEAKDKYTEGHTERVTRFSVRLATELALSAETVDAIRQGARLHDIGKLGVPDQILTKSSALTSGEIALVREHPMIGYRICAALQSVQHALPGIRWHHERPNGKGYPDGLAGEKLPVAPRVIAVADVFDALTSDRSYRAAMPHPQALKIMREMAERGDLDAEVVRCFLDARLAEHPAERSDDELARDEPIEPG